MTSTPEAVRAPSASASGRSPVAAFVNIAVPPLGLVFAMRQLRGVALQPIDVILLVVLYTATGLGVTVGLHRLFTHRSFEAARSVRAVLAVLAAMAVEGYITDWVADHRCHHAHSDVEGDPHSPHLGRRGGLRGRLGGLWHAHMGWIFRRGPVERRARYAKDLCDDPLIRTIDRAYLLWVVLTLGLPFAVGYAAGGTAGRGFEALVWGGLIRVLLIHHATWSVNSICHSFGTRPYRARDESRNNWLLALPTLGESWHNNHHAFPSSAVLGIDRRQLDIGAWVIRGLERSGLAWDVHRPDARQRARRRSSGYRSGPART
jgi:stearoyl-CoA desaturase (delta-9 desaturase)